MKRFWDKVDKSGDCWLWTACIASHGYGQFHIAKSRPVVRAHRFAWQLEHGSIPAGLCVLHSCDVKACVNPAHLFLGTQADNVRDMIAKRRISDRRGAMNSSAKLDEEAVRVIRIYVEHGHEQNALARHMGISYTTVRNIMTRQTWKHVI